MKSVIGLVLMIIGLISMIVSRHGKRFGLLDGAGILLWIIGALLL